MAEIDRLKGIVETLRSENGCPWDRVQTHESLKPECIEEAAEVINGINNYTKTGDAENLKEELGDLLLQVMFHSVIAEEEGLFTFDDVAKTVSEKMVRRHPHVFAGVTYNSKEEQHVKDFKPQYRNSFQRGGQHRLPFCFFDKDYLRLDRQS